MLLPSNVFVRSARIYPIGGCKFPFISSRLPKTANATAVFVDILVHFGVYMYPPASSLLLQTPSG
jgi:hypothetical protein